MIGCIYKITNLINGKVYIGQTIQSLKDRWYRHCGNSGSKVEKNMAIKKAIRKYGKENFTIECLEECEQNLLNEKEKYYISYYNSYNEGYNSTLGGQDGSKLPQTPKEVELKIIDLYKYGFSLRAVGKEFNIDKATIKAILKRHNIDLRVSRTYKLSSNDRQDIVDKITSGVTRKEIINQYKISKSYLSQLLSNNRRI